MVIGSVMNHLMVDTERIRIKQEAVAGIFNNLNDERWSEAETIEALREAGLVTFLDLQKGNNTSCMLDYHLFRLGGCVTWTAWERQRDGRGRRRPPFFGCKYRSWTQKNK